MNDIAEMREENAHKQRVIEKRTRKSHKMRYEWWLNVGKLVCCSLAEPAIRNIRMYTNYCIYFCSPLRGQRLSTTTTFRDFFL